MNQYQTEIWTVLRLVQWGTEYFKKKRVDSPRLTIELMLAHTLNMKRFDLYMQYDRPLLEDELATLKSMIQRRAAREPLQYILGEAHFHRRVFHVRPGVLIPRPETELLVDEALRRTKPLRCLDVGTGSGCIAITVALEHPETEVMAIDISEDALEIAKQNATELGAKHIEFRNLDIFNDEAVRAIGSFDLVISNPPYIADLEIQELQTEVRDHEPHVALSDGGDGLRFYRRLAALAPTLLRKKGEFFLELGYNQAKPVRKLFEEQNFSVEIYQDFEKTERILRAYHPETPSGVL